MAAEDESPRLRKMMELARLHDEWARTHADDAGFRPDEHAGPDSDSDSDYNLHNVDVDPSAEAEREFMTRARQIMGLDPRTGRRMGGAADGDAGTGGAAQTLAAAVTAAREDDLDRLRGLVDWPLTGVGQMAQSLAGVLERDRERVTASGLAELDAAAADPSMVEEILRPLARRLAGARDIGPAGEPARSAALAVLRVPPLPPGLNQAQRHRMVELGERAAAIREVYLIADGEGGQPVAVAADSYLLVLILD